MEIRAMCVKKIIEFEYEQFSGLGCSLEHHREEIKLGTPPLSLTVGVNRLLCNFYACFYQDSRTQ